MVELPTVPHRAGPYGPPLLIQSCGLVGSAPASGIPSKSESRQGIGESWNRPFDQENSAAKFRSSFTLKLASASMPLTLTSAL